MCVVFFLLMYYCLPFFLPPFFLLLFVVFVILLLWRRSPSPTITYFSTPTSHNKRPKETKAKRIPSPSGQLLRSGCSPPSSPSSPSTSTTTRPTDTQTFPPFKYTMQNHTHRIFPLPAPLPPPPPPVLPLIPLASCALPSLRSSLLPRQQGTITLRHCNNVRGERRGVEEGGGVRVCGKMGGGWGSREKGGVRVPSVNGVVVGEGADGLKGVASGPCCTHTSRSVLNTGRG